MVLVQTTSNGTVTQLLSNVGQDAEVATGAATFVAANVPALFGIAWNQASAHYLTAQGIVTPPSVRCSCLRCDTHSCRASLFVGYLLPANFAGFLLTPGVSCAQVAGIVSVLVTPLYLWFFMYKLRWGLVGAACSCVLTQCPAATILHTINAR